ncbi:4-hydroxybenzoate octaprenyltransferase [Rhizobium sp. CFBP 8762]|uniref:4-hydroxybenzoate octaprenyltransferase n=1 Tax=Rhizobium sp. CFBP 8762 TaxID=2775279 RepID=UPI001782E115|nr:4-hydroxybenzoate octaprenyltransferase [Rhizobium sp. CFBP 8762]MBD8553296.1 4-hydroxybenzoate octaprenyltransferase [Rhizobium sp. CFBP 8762]
MSNSQSDPSDSGRVYDAPSDTFVYRALPRSLWPHAQLARWDRPIGWQLLMWPCFWSAAMAANVAAQMGVFSGATFLWHLALFFIGSVAMRGAGCTYNDLIDHDIDNQVARTRSRPLPAGRITRWHAKLFILAQALVGLLVLLQFNWFTVGLGVFSLVFVAVYPFAKRFTDWPQFFLGLAFSWGALMGWAATFGTVSQASVLLYLGAIAWTVGYDTIYAYQDVEDDELIGVRSTARRFGDRPKPWLIGLYGLTMLLFLLAFVAAGLGMVAYLGLGIAAGLLAYQIVVLDIRNPAQCLQLFKFNRVVGLMMFISLLIALIIRLAA